MPAGFGYQSQTWSVTRSGCQKPNAAPDAGMAVPADVGIVGSTDTLFAAHATPAITSLQVFPEKLGARAVDLVLRALDDERVESAVVPTAVVVRESTLRSGRRTDC
jgi:DNA-binding LacI/PurR family transcriptional regulator